MYVGRAGCVVQILLDREVMLRNSAQLGGRKVVFIQDQMACAFSSHLKLTVAQVCKERKKRRIKLSSSRSKQ